MMKSNFKDKRLLCAFGALIFLMCITGITAIICIHNLSRRVEKLGKQNLILEKAILEMKISNTLYTMGIRNYVFWRISHYLGAVPLAVNLENILAAGTQFNKELKVYEENSYSLQQRQWAAQIKLSSQELFTLGKQIIDLSNLKQTPDADERIKNLLMVFENRLYRINKFLDNTVGKENLKEIEQQLMQADSDKRKAILFLNLILITVVLAGCFIALSVSKRIENDHLYRQRLLNHMINLEENERKNLSAQIHDQLGQDLSALKIYLGLIEQNLANPQGRTQQEKLEQCRRLVSGLLDKSHNIAFLLRPPVLDEVGLIESIEALLVEYKHLIGINYNYQKPKEKLILNSEYSLLIYRLAQELLNNMAKYSKAKNVEINLKKTQNSLEFIYSDDGIGFQYDKIMAQPRRRTEDKFKLGLLGLKERVELLDGLMTVDTAIGKGARVRVRLNI